MAEVETLRVATLNIWNRFGPWDQRLPAIREGVRALSPDLLGLQEVLRLDPGEGDALEALGAGRKADAGPMLAYFAPLRAWLAEANKGAHCGW